MMSDRELAMAAILVFSAVAVLIFSGHYALEERKAKRQKRRKNRARMYEIRRDRLPVIFENYERDSAEYRKKREREILGKPEPLRKAVGLFSDDMAQECVR